MKLKTIGFVIALVLLITAIPVFAGDVETENEDFYKIPKWLAESETYGIGPQWEDIDGTAWKFVTHIPGNKEFLSKARAKGIRAFPYITCYQAPLFRQYQSFSLSDNADWILINEKGEWEKNVFWDSEDQKNWYVLCPNCKGYRDAVLAYVETLMQWGASGIFIDNVGIPKDCFADKFGKHEHLFETQVEAYADFLKAIRQMIKKYDPDGALLINSASPATLPKEFWPYIDCEMSESYICTWASTERWGDWKNQWNGMDKKIPQEKQVCCLSYMGHTKNPIKDDIYFCYASTRLMNFIWAGCSGTGPSNGSSKDPAARKLFSITTGKPVSEETISGEIHYRRFVNGIVAVNPSDADGVFTVEGQFPTSAVFDLYNEKQISIANDKIELAIPAQSGRVWLYAPSMNHSGQVQNNFLTIKTEPGLGNTVFEIDGIPMTTMTGRRVINYEKGTNYGTITACFTEPGYHTIEAVDVTRESLIPGDKEKKEDSGMSKQMDPADPTQFAAGVPYRFSGWQGAVESTDKKIKVYVKENIVIIAEYEKK